MDSSRCIARKSLELEYSWDSKGYGKTEIISIGNIVQYNKSKIDVYYILHGYQKQNRNHNLGEEVRPPLKE